MQQMQSRTQGSDGSGQQKKYQYRNGSSEAGGSGSGGENGSGNMYQGSQGQGGGHAQGGKGMREIMQSLPQEDQDALKAKMGEISMEDRMAMVSQLKEVDKTTMSNEEYVQALLDILDTSNSEEETQIDSFFSICVILSRANI